MSTEGVAIACGASSPDPDTEARFRALREQDGHALDAGCGKSLAGLGFWLQAYRCVECARWFHHECILAHFRESGDGAAATPPDHAGGEGRP